MARYPPLGQLGPQAIARVALATQTRAVRVEGRQHFPREGPVLLVARHIHHLLDGSVLVRSLPRPIHIVVGLDWATTRTMRRVMEGLCRAADYPIVLRAPTVERTGAYRRAELVRYTRRALDAATRLLRAGRVVLIFPEGYPTIDPAGTRKPEHDDWLPFAPGFSRMIARAERDGRTHVALVPVGFAYARAPAGRRPWSIVARLGPALCGPQREPAAVESIVRTLSDAAVATASSATERRLG